MFTIKRLWWLLPLGRFSLDIQDDFSHNLRSHPAYLRASLPSMPAHLMERLSLFGNEKPIDFSVPDLVDLPANGMADFLSKGIIYPLGFGHRFSILLRIFEPLPAHQATKPHDGARERAAGFPSPGHTPGQGASGLKNIRAAHLQLFLQSCKNGLGSTEIVHVILKGQFENLIQEFLSILHPSILLKNIERPLPFMG
jgi:hypothetical protein